MMKKRCFTLIEILMVVAIIAVLMGLLIPGINSVREKAKEAKAKTELTAIKTAIKAYESTYGIFPATRNVNGDLKLGGSKVTDADAEYDKLIHWLTQAPTDDNDPNPADMGEGNTRKIRFLDPANAAGNATYADPWGNRYVIYMDTNYDGKVTIATQLNGDVFVYSYGKNAEDNNGLRKGVNSQNKNDDDIGSWHN
ncbi:MAG: type II secretion system protein [Victivallales bacterium]|nr:type II secretion system protein [Victivallales bacterium]